MSHSRTRLVVACIVGLVLLTSVGTVAAAPNQTTPVEPTADSVSDSVDVDLDLDRQPVSTSVPFDATDATPTLDLVDDSPSQATLQADSSVGEGPLGPSGLVALAGYSRLSESDPLDNSLRSRLYETVQSFPGIYPAALVDRLDTPRSTLRYHLRVLEDEDLVDVRTVDGKRRYVATDATAAERALSVIDEGTTASKLVEALASDGSATVSELATRLDRSPGTVTYHLDRLEDSAVVERERDGQAVQNSLAPGVTPLVTSVDATTSDPFRVTTDD